MITYTLSTANATNTVTATAAKTGAAVVLKVNDVAHTSGDSATWNLGANTVTAAVTYGTTTRTYTVTVTKTA